MKNANFFDCLATGLGMMLSIYSIIWVCLIQTILFLGVSAYMLYRVVASNKLYGLPAQIFLSIVWIAIIYAGIYAVKYYITIIINKRNKIDR